MKQYNGTTRTLELGQTGFRNVIFKPSKPPLDSELNFVGDLNKDLSKLQIQQLANSGFFPNARAFSIGYDDAGNTYGINLTNTPNKFILKNLNNEPFKVNILGDVVDFGGTASNEPSKIEITLPAAPGSGSREDLVMLEVWYKQILPQPSTVGKPTATEVYAYGNIESGLSPVADDIYYPLIGTATTDRVQVQYRVRVIPGVNFGNFPSGLGDPIVTAQGGQPTPGAYSFFAHASDKGCYIAGDGTPTAQASIGSVDGYSYAIPLFRVHRRNASPFSLNNLNGAGKTISFGSSDRPDGYYNDKIEISDIEDLRHVIALGMDTEEILDYNFKSLLGEELGTILTESSNSNDVAHSLVGLHVDAVSQTDEAGVTDFAVPNQQRRVFGDAKAIQRTTQQYQLNDRTFPMAPAPVWTIGDKLTVALNLQSPTGTVFGKRMHVYAVVKNGATEEVVEIPSSKVFMVNEVVLTLGTIPSGVTTQQITVDFDIVYPSGFGMSNVPKNLLKVYEVADNVNYSFVDTNQPDGIREGSLVPVTGIASDYAIGLDPQKAFTTLYEYTINGDGSTSYNIPAGLGGVPITHVYKVFINNAFVSRTVGTIKVTDVVFNGDDTITVNFDGAIPGISTIKFFVALSNNAVLVDKQTKSIDEISESSYAKKTIPLGSNLTTVVFDVGTPVFAAQASAINSLDDKQSYVFINGTETACDTEIRGNYIIVTLPAPIGVGTTDEIQVAYTKGKVLGLVSQLQLFYQFAPYQGVTARVSFDKGPDSYVKTKVVDRAIGFLIHSSGTGGKNKTVNDNFSPISVKLPIATSHRDGMLSNDPLAAPIYPTAKGIDENADFTFNNKFAITFFETYNDWYEEGFDTQVARDNYRTMFLGDSVRVNKSGVGSSIALSSKDVIDTDWSTVISNTGNIQNGKRLVFWYYVPDPSKLNTVGLHLHTSTGDHIYKVTGNYQTGWNRAEFISRTEGTGTINTVTKVQIRYEVINNSTTMYGLNFMPPYLEDNSVVIDELLDGDVYYSTSEESLFRFLQDRGVYRISDGVGVEALGDRAYSFDVPFTTGVHTTASSKNSPYVLGKENLISKVGVVSSRGTYKGSNFYTNGMSTLSAINKQAVMYLLEQVLEDPTGNFVPGEYVLRVETRIEGGKTVKITNDDFDNLNSYDLYRCKGRPLGRV